MFCKWHTRSHGGFLCSAASFRALTLAAAMSLSATRTLDAADAPPRAPIAIPAAASAVESDGPRYAVTGIKIEFIGKGRNLPRPQEMLGTSVTLGQVSDGYVAPRAGVPSRSYTLAQLSAQPNIGLYKSAIDTIKTSLTAEMTADKPGRRYLGVYTDVNPEELGEDNADKRTISKYLTFRISPFTVEKIRTVASGDRLSPTAERINNEAHRAIAEHSPVKPGGDLLRRDLLDDYVLSLNRYPSRHVDVALSAGDTVDQNQAVLDYLVNETKPLTFYAGVSNTGTKETSEWRQRVGLVWNQVSKRDDTLTLDYVTSSFDKSNAVSFGYDAPVPKLQRLRYRVFAQYDQFDASQFALRPVNGIRFTGSQIGGGGELIANLFQHRQLFVDAIGGLRFDQYHVSNGLLGSKGDAGFLTPYVGLRLESLTDAASTVGELTLNYSTTSDSSANVQNLGRFPSSRDWLALRGAISHSLFLDPLFPKFLHKDRLASEISLSARGQFVPGSRRLIPQEEGIIGGLYSVRGYPEAIADGDNSLVLSAEYRYHIGRGRSIQEKPGTFMGQPFRYAPQEAYGRTDWDVVPKVFIDAGWTNHNIRQATNETDASLLSAGVGVDVFLKQNVSLRLDYGFALRDYHSPGNSTGVSAGDGRLHFALTVQY